MYTNYILLTFIPFIIADLYYAYHEGTCVDHKIDNTKISFPLRLWLKVSGYTNLFLFILPLLTYLVPTCGATILLVHSLYFFLFIFFRFAWLVVGAIMFWGYLWPHRFCASGFNSYMWVNLIVGFLQILLLFFFQREFKNQVEVERTKQRSIG
jgi:hypothetical protein